MIGKPHKGGINCYSLHQKQSLLVTCTCYTFVFNNIVQRSTWRVMPPSRLASTRPRRIVHLRWGRKNMRGSRRLQLQVLSYADPYFATLMLTRSFYNCYFPFLPFQIILHVDRNTFLNNRTLNFSNILLDYSCSSM